MLPGGSRRPVSAGMPAPPAWVPSSVAPAVSARSAFPPRPGPGCGPSPPGRLGGHCAPLPHAVFQPLLGVKEPLAPGGPPRTSQGPRSSLFHSAEMAEAGVSQAAPGPRLRGCGGAAGCWSGRVGLPSSALTEPPTSALGGGSALC